MKYLYIGNLTGIQKEFYDLIESDLMGETIKIKNERIQNLINFFTNNKDHKIDFLYIIEKQKKGFGRNGQKENTDFRALNPLGFIIKFLNHENIDPILRKKALYTISQNSTDEMFSLNSILKFNNDEMKEMGIPDFYYELNINDGFKLEISQHKILKLLITEPLQRYRKLSNFSEKELNDIFDDINLIFTNKERKILGIPDYNNLINDIAIINIIEKEQRFEHTNLKIIDILLNDKKSREEFILQLYADTYKKNFLQLRIKEQDPFNKYQLRKMIEQLPFFDYNKIPGDSNYPEDSFVDTLYKNQEHHKLKEIESYIMEKNKLEKDFSLLIETQIKIYIDSLEDSNTRNASLKKISENMNSKTFEMYAKYKGLQLDEWLKTYESKIRIDRYEKNRYQKLINLLEVSKINVEKEELDNLFTTQPQNNIKQRL